MESKTLKIMPKPEAWAYDELDFLSSLQPPSPLQEKLLALKDALSQDKTQKAVFFMPKNTFDIFSLFQGDNQICEVILEDACALLDFIQEDGNPVPQAAAAHFCEKLTTLKNYLEAGNSVKPVVISVNDFSELYI